MTRNKLGTNQYRTKHRFVSDKTANSIWKLIAFCSVGVFLTYRFQAPVISPLPDNPVSFKIYAEEPKAPTTKDVIAYIAEIFAPEGKAVVVKAINCFYGESGLRPNAEGWNAWNNTFDRGVAQINDIHKMSKEDAFDYKKNIRKAYQIYKSRGNFSAWYAPSCR